MAACVRAAALLTLWPRTLGETGKAYVHARARTDRASGPQRVYAYRARARARPHRDAAYATALP